MRYLFDNAARPVRKLGALLLVCAALGATGCGDPSGFDDGEVMIGGLFSLTGNWSSLGLTSQAALELGVQDANLFLADRGLRFRAELRDTRLDPQLALAGLQQLRSAGAQIVIGPQSSAELAVLKPYVDAHPVLVVSQSSTAGSLAVAGDHILRLTPADSLEGVAVSALMWDDGIRAVVPAWRADAGNQGLHTATAARFGSLGGAVWTGVEYGTGTTNFSATVAALSAQVGQALATRPASQVAVYLAGFDEVAQLFAAAAADPTLASVRWYGSDGVALSPALLTPAAAAFAEAVGYPNPIFGLDDSARDTWRPVADRIRARSGLKPDAFALAVYDAVWIAAHAYAASDGRPSLPDLQERFEAAAATYHGTTGWIALNAAGDRRYADFDFWAIRTINGTRTWTRVAHYDTRLGRLTRP